MKLKEKVTACLLLLALAGSVSAYAQTEIKDIRYDGSTITVTVTADGAEGDRVSFTVKKQDTDEMTGTVAVLEDGLDSSREASFVFTIPDERAGAATDGTYIVSAKAGKDTPASQPLIFVSAPNRRNVLAQLKASADAAALGELLDDADITNAVRIMGVKAERYAQLNSAGKNDFLSALFGRLSGITNEEVLSAAANNEIARATINHGAAGEVADALGITDIAYDGQGYADVTDADLASWIAERVYADRTYADVAALEREYTLVNIFYELNHVFRSDLKSLLQKHAETLNLTGNSVYQDYLKRVQNNELQIASEFVRLVNANPIYAPEDVPARLNQAMSNAGVTGGSGSGGSSGGSPGGGNGGGGSGSSGGNKGGGITSGGSGGIKTNTNIAGANSSAEVGTQENLSRNFWDLDSTPWAVEAIDALADRGVLNGVGDGRFDPNRTVTREEFAKILALAYGYKNEEEAEEAEADADAAEPEAGEEAAPDEAAEEEAAPAEDTALFSDVDSGLWYAPYVTALTKAGIIKGVSADLFGVGMELSRQDLAVLLYRVGGGSLTAVREWTAFSDYDRAGDYAKEAIKALYCSGCIDGMGDGTFQPEAPCTRAEAAKMIYQILEQ